MRPAARPAAPATPVGAVSFCAATAFPDHSKKHAADVTNRVMAILNHTGLANIMFEKLDLPISLVMMVAASVHDYGKFCSQSSRSWPAANACP